MPDISVDSIREALPITGRTILEVTCTDHAEDILKYPNPDERKGRIFLHLDDGSTASFVVGEGDLGFSYDGYPENHPFVQDSDAGGG
jgi:hypothetical protein